MEIRPGTVTALVGPNGAGKTTLLHVLATIHEPSTGSVSFGKKSFAVFSRKHRNRIGWVGHQSLLYEELTGRENLQLFAELYGVASPNDVVHKWLERVGLLAEADRPSGTYSRGMKQRLSIARALIHRPSILLLDEPFSGLDRAGSAVIVDILMECKRDGRTVVLVTHDLELCHPTVDSVAVLHNGSLVEHHVLGDGESLLDAYQRYIQTA